MNADGTSETNVTNDLDSGEDESPDWSPDGTKLLFTRTRPGHDEQHRGHERQRHRRKSHRPRAVYGTWSPDGKRIAMLRQVICRHHGRAHHGGGRHRRDPGDARRWRESSSALPAATAAKRRSPRPLSSSPDTIVFGEDATVTSTVTSPGPPRNRLVRNSASTARTTARPRRSTRAATRPTTSAFLLDVGDVVSATYSGSAVLGWSTGDAPLGVLAFSTVNHAGLVAQPGHQWRADRPPRHSRPYRDRHRAVRPRPALDRRRTHRRPPLELDDNGQVDAVRLGRPTCPRGSYTVPGGLRRRHRRDRRLSTQQRLVRAARHGSGRRPAPVFRGPAATL